MDSTPISDKRHLFAWGITDGALDDMGEEQRASLLLTITEIKESMLKDYQPTESDRKNTKKYQNNRGGQNNGKVSK